MQLTSKRIEVEDALECIGSCYRENMTDGLPVVPPTEKRVQQFVAATGLAPDTKLADITERARVITVEKLAINAVMAGCLPEYMPILVAAVEAIAEPKFKFNHLASLGSPWPLLIVSGPIVKKLDMHYGRFLLGSGNRPNATIGRAISLLLWNCCELRPDAIQRGNLGNPSRYTSCIAEDPNTLWEGLNEWEGFDRNTSTVTVNSGYQLCMARTTGSEPRAILAPLVNAMVNHEFLPGCFVIMVAPPLEQALVAKGWTKRIIRDYLFEECKRSVKSLKESGRWGRFTTMDIGGLKDLIPVQPGDENRWAYLFKRDPELDRYYLHEAAYNRRTDVMIVAAGGDAAGVFGIQQPYAASTEPVTKVIKA